MKNKYDMLAGWWQFKIYDIMGQEIAEAMTGKRMLTIKVTDLAFHKQCCSEKQFKREISFVSEVIKRPNKKDLVQINFSNSYCSGVFVYSEFHTNFCEIG